MKELDIVNTIRAIERESKVFNDGGATFIKYLAQEIFYMLDENKNCLFDFFEKEIKQNRYGFFSIVLQLVIELKSIEFATRIESIYLQNKNTKDEIWQYSMIETLLKLNYITTSSIYDDFIETYFKEHPDNSFFILVQYCNINQAKGLPLLSDFYSKYLLNNGKMKSFLESRIGFLVDYLIAKSSLSELNRLVVVKNKEAGLYLRKILLNYLNSNWATKYENELIEKEKKALKHLPI